MTQYVKSTSFSSKDALPAGNPLKIVKGTEIDTEFNNIAVAVGSKADLLSPVFTGTPTAPTASTGTSTTQVATTAFATAAISPFTGSMLMWPTATPPAGFLLCNGQTASRATYAALFAIVGTLFGAGDGSTTFTLPDYRNRTVLGAGDLYSANSQGGSKDATLPSHNHTGTTDAAGGATGSTSGGNGSGDFGTYNAASGVFSLSGGAPNRPQGSAGGGSQTTATMNIPNHAHSFTTNAAGSSATNANLPPYLGIFFIIKT
jgi:microcystin-dependent protein